jgi:hypothetical protein
VSLQRGHFNFAKRGLYYFALTITMRVYFRILEKVRESGHAEKEECPDESKPRGKESAIDGAA